MLELAHGDRFEIRKELGSGGMGRVYEALDRERNALVALKTLQSASASAIARFKSEFRSLADVVHPNLVGLYELIVDGAKVYYTMELVEGVHFDAYVRPIVDGSVTESSSRKSQETETTRAVVGGSTGSDSGSSDPREVAPVGELDLRRLRIAMRQLAEGVSAIHEAGKLHRDLKPSNVMVGPTGRVVVLDFGLVSDLEADSFMPAERRPLEGTAAYMSPEQGARAKLTPASDWYAVGVMLYYALTGRRPFLGGRDDVLMDKQRFEPPPPAELVPDLPSDLATLCSELLRRDPVRRPAGPEILRRLGSDAMMSPASTITFSTASHSEVIVGRTRELTFLEQAWRSSLEGAPVLVHVAGQSGMGKSRVMRAFIDQVGKHNSVLALRGRCYERESMPFKAVDSLIDALARFLGSLEPIEVEGLMPRDANALARVFPVLRQVDAVTSARRRDVVAPDPQELRRRAFAALRELFTRLSDRHPLVLAIDDVQWGDVDSAGLIAALLRGREPPPIMLLTSWRSDERDASEFLLRLDEELRETKVDVRELQVGPLSDEHARELAMIHLGKRSDLSEQAARIADEAQGSPFFVEELARHARDVRGPLEITLDEALRSRLLRLPDSALRLLSTVAVAGRPILQALAVRAAGVADPSMLSLLKAGSFLQPRTIDGARYVEPYHDRIREAAVAMLPDDDQREIHLRLAHLFEANVRPDPEVLATHYAGAGESSRAAEFAVEAARRASSALAFDRAASFYRMALELAPDEIDREVLVELGDALANAGRGAESAAAYDRAAAGAGSAEALDLRCRAASQLLYSGHIADGLNRLEGVLDSAGMKMASSPRRAILSLLWNRMRLSLRGLRYTEREEREIPASQLMRVDVSFAVTEGLGFSDTIRGADFHGRSVLLALKAGEPKRVLRAAMAEAIFLSMAGYKKQAKVDQILAMGDELSQRLDDPASRAFYVGARGMTAFNFGRWEEAIDYCARGEAMLRDQVAGMRFEIGAAQLYQCFGMAISGRVRDMVRVFPRLMHEAYERGDLFLATNLRAALGVYVPLLENRPDEAYAEVDAAIDRWPQQGFHLPHCNAMGARVYTDMYRADDMTAYQRCEREWPALEKSGLLWVQVMRVLSWSTRGRAALCAYRQTRDSRPKAIVKKAIRVLEGQGVDYARAMGLTIRGGLEYVDHGPERALPIIEASEDLADSAGLLLHCWAARWVRGYIVGGVEGGKLMRSAEKVLREEGMERPEGVARIFAPVVDID